MSPLRLLAFAALIVVVSRCIPTVSPDDDDIMAQLEEMYRSTTESPTTCESTTTISQSSTSTDTSESSSSTSTEPSTSTTTSASTTTTTTECTTCTCPPPGFDTVVLYGTTCYIFDGYTGYAGAETGCQMRGGSKIFVPNSENEFNFVLGQIPATTETYWLGAERLTVGDPFEWNDGTLFSWTNWASGEPVTTPTDALCIEFIGTMGGDFGKWRAVPCNTGKRVICEVAATMAG